MSEIVGGITAELDLTLRNPDDISSPNDPLKLVAQWPIAPGTGDGQADLCWHGRVTLGPGSDSEELDLVGVLTDAFGDTFSPARIKALIVTCHERNEAAIDFGGAASPN